MAAADLEGSTLVPENGIHVARGAPLPRLRALRIERLLTQEELARAAGVSAATIVRLEHEGAHAELRTIQKLARALDVPPAALMRGAGDRE